MGTGFAISQARVAEAARKIAETRREEAEKARRIAEMEHARAERERDLAVAEQRRSQERLTQMVSLSDHSLSGVYALMERLPGAVPARTEMIRTTLAFLEKLSTEAGSDPHLQLALAKAYRGLGELQFDPTSDLRGALKSYRAGAALVEDASRTSTPDRERLTVWLRLQLGIGEVLGHLADPTASHAAFRHALDVANRLPPPVAAEVFSEKEASRARSWLYLWLARSSPPDFHAARDYGLSFVSEVEALRKRFPGDADFDYDLSVGQVAMAWAYNHLDDPETAVGFYEAAMHLRERLVKDHPDDHMYRSALMLSYTHYAGVQGGPFEPSLGHLELARAYYRKAQPLEEAEVADPKDSAAAGVYAMFLLKMAALDVPGKDWPNRLPPCAAPPRFSNRRPSLSTSTAPTWPAPTTTSACAWPTWEVLRKRSTPTAARLPSRMRFSLCTPAITMRSKRVSSPRAALLACWRSPANGPKRSIG